MASTGTPADDTPHHLVRLGHVWVLSVGGLKSWGMENPITVPVIITEAPDGRKLVMVSLWFLWHMGFGLETVTKASSLGGKAHQQVDSNMRKLPFVYHMKVTGVLLNAVKNVCASIPAARKHLFHVMCYEAGSLFEKVDEWVTSHLGGDYGGLDEDTLTMMSTICHEWQDAIMGHPLVTHVLGLASTTPLSNILDPMCISRVSTLSGNMVEDGTVWPPRRRRARPATHRPPVAGPQVPAAIPPQHVPSVSHALPATPTPTPPPFMGGASHPAPPPFMGDASTPHHGPPAQPTTHPSITPHTEGPAMHADALRKSKGKDHVGRAHSDVVGTLRPSKKPMPVASAPILQGLGKALAITPTTPVGGAPSHPKLSIVEKASRDKEHGMKEFIKPQVQLETPPSEEELLHLREHSWGVRLDVLVSQLNKAEAVHWVGNKPGTTLDHLNLPKDHKWFVKPKTRYQSKLAEAQVELVQMWSLKDTNSHGTLPSGRKFWISPTTVEKLKHTFALLEHISRHDVSRGVLGWREVVGEHQH
jgi:hypothetical protein